MGRGRVSALGACATALAVFLAQGVSPSYAGITVTTFGSDESVPMRILETRGGVPTRIAAYPAGSVDPLVSAIDPAVVRGAVWTPAEGQGGWISGRLALNGGGAPPVLDVSYRDTGSGLEATASDPADPAGAIHVVIPRGGTESEMVVDPVSVAIAVIIVCGLVDTYKMTRCMNQAQHECGEDKVKCSTYAGGCGIGWCTHKCVGDAGDCN